MIKRDVIEGEKADDARKQFNRAANRALRARTKGAEVEEVTEAASATIVVAPPPAVVAASTEKPEAQ